jgi:hypothetical protein
MHIRNSEKILSRVADNSVREDSLVHRATRVCDEWVDSGPTDLAAWPGLQSESNFRFRCYRAPKIGATRLNMSRGRFLIHGLPGGGIHSPGRRQLQNRAGSETTTAGQNPKSP